VAHESVLRSWPKFSDWLKEFGAFKLWRSGLNEARRRWLKQQDPSELLAGPRLKEALLKRRERSSWLTAEEDQFIGLSLGRRRWSALRMGAVIAFLPLLVGVYFWWIEAEKLTHTVVYRLALAHLGFYASLEPKMVRIPPTGDCSPQQACTFQMGSPPDQCKADRQNECPQHPVQFARPFLMGQTEVSFDEWEVFRLMIEREGGCRTKDSKTGQVPEHKLGDRSIQDSGFGRGGRPLINVSWEDAQCYITWLNGKTKPEHPYRLPTEAEWEYAARAGSGKAWFWGDDPEQAGDHAWFSGNSQNMTHPVGADKTRNAYGLYDMAGNVYEWTADCWHESYADAPKDGKAWEEAGKGGCARRVIRGGSWFYSPDYLRSAYRYVYFIDFRNDNIGFRLAQDL
jgi:formylglycine-generating enzyme required for sulfatase activity